MGSNKKSTKIKYSIGKGKQQIVLAKICGACSGEGKLKVYAATIDCEDCDGLGLITTEDGAQILALVDELLFKGRD